MSSPETITDDISRIQDKLAAIVTRDLIAGKVTSLRDAPRIVSIGRVIAELDDVAGAVFELAEIVEDRAAERSEEGVGVRGEEGSQTVEEFWEGLAEIERAREATEERARQAEEIITNLTNINPIIKNINYHYILYQKKPIQ